MKERLDNTFWWHSLYTFSELNKYVGVHVSCLAAYITEHLLNEKSGIAFTARKTWSFTASAKRSWIFNQLLPSCTMSSFTALAASSLLFPLSRLRGSTTLFTSSHSLSLKWRPPLDAARSCTARYGSYTLSQSPFTYLCLLKCKQGGRNSSLVVFVLAVHSVAGSILLWRNFPVEGIFPFELTWVQTPFPKKLFRMKV